MMHSLINSTNLASVLGVSNSTVNSWVASGKISPIKKDKSYFYFDSSILPFPELKEMNASTWEKEESIKPLKQFNSIELFAGGGGLALGLHEAGFNQILFNEFDHDACKTLRNNFKNSNVIEGDVHNVDFTPYRGKIDFLSGGFPCQAFSYAGNQKGFEDARGTLFFELARAIEETQPKVFLGENVKGLVSHDNGKTFKVISRIIDELGYYLVPPRVLKAVMYKVPQKRERIFLVGIRKDFADKVTFHWPSPYHRVMTLQDTFYKGELYDCDVPKSIGQKYPKRKAEILSLVPQGGDWRDLPEDLQKEYMKGSFYLGGGKTGMARRLSLNEPSLTLTCAPAQKQTERCHPLETRPLTVREYARIQTFPDSWEFFGSESSQYKQIGNAVPVNLAKAMGHSLIQLLNDITQIEENHITQFSKPTGSQAACGLKYCYVDAHTGALIENMKVYNYKSVKSIEKEGIIFSDGFKIIFQDCINGFAKHYNSFTDVSTCIAERNILERPPYFQFYLDDMNVKIIFDCKGLFANKRNNKLFQDFQLKIKNLGYKTFDLT